MSSTGALIYIRVSDPAQADKKYNLPTQQKKVEDRCERDELKVLKTFVDVDSARTAERPQFQEMLTYCRKHKGKVTHVVFADLSRLARNIQDQSITLATFNQLGITPVSCDETIENSAAGKLAVNMLGIINQFYSDSLSERIRYRMSAGVQSGRWLWLAPIGYLNVKANGASELKIDPARADLVKRAFELTASRNYTLEEVLRRLNLLGLRTRRNRGLTKQTLSRMLKNEIYAGWVVSNGNKVKGIHDPIVSQDLFDAVQDALNGKNAAPVIHKKVNEEFPLKGFVKCTTCGGKLTAGFAKGRKERYPRYWCWNPKCPAKVSVSREEIETNFVTILGHLGPTQELLNRLPEIAKNYWAKRLERITSDRRTFSNRLADAKTLNQRILLQKVQGQLSPEDFAVLRETVTQQMQEAQNQLNALDAETLTMESLLEEYQQNIIDLVKAWRESDTQRKQELAFNLFPEGLYYSRESKFFEPRNTWLWQSFSEWFQSLDASQNALESFLGKLENIGAGDGI